MRADPGQELTAETVINEYSGDELTAIFRDYGEERRARQAAARIIEARQESRINSVEQLGDILQPVLSVKYFHRSLARIWMALRIVVNDELNALREGLTAAVSALAVGGRVVVFAYHSLEDRIAKRLFREWSRTCGCSPALGACTCGADPKIRLLTRHPVTPDEDEIRQNSRAASAKLRAAEKVAPGSVTALEGDLWR
jgi:16S rRNA (cytosine1402-N4)-methyltransferase